MTEILYPRLIKRVRALLIDSAVIPMVAVALVALAYALHIADVWVRLAIIVMTVLILEPGLVALTGGTVGHHCVGIKVTRMDGVNKPGFLAATLRTLVKYVLGWFSLILVLTTKRHQAVHDLIARSLVSHRSASRLPAYEVLRERQVESNRFIYPPAWRRVLMSLVWWLLMAIALTVVAELLISRACTAAVRCTTFDYLLSLVISIAWLAGTGALCVLGWNAHLPGGRRVPKAQTSTPSGSVDAGIE